MKIKLDGVMFHTALAEKTKGGFSDLQFHNAEEEFESYLELLKHVGFKEIGDIVQPDIIITENTMEEYLTIYEEWEKETLRKLRMLEKDEYVEESIKDVLKELHFIRCMWDDVYEGKSEQLDKWLHKKFGE